MGMGVEWESKRVYLLPNRITCQKSNREPEAKTSLLRLRG